MEIKEEKLTDSILDDTGEADLTENRDRIVHSLRTGTPLPEQTEMQPLLKKLAKMPDEVPEEFKL